MKTKNKFIISGACAAAFVLLIWLLSFVDVGAVGPCDTSVGFSKLNHAFSSLVGYNGWLYVITDILGLAVFSLAGIFGLFGAWQWYKRKNILKVDWEILALGVLYLITIGCYVLFELVVVNCRPVLMAGEVMPESSFPSSHTVLSLVVLCTAMILFKKYVKSAKQRRIMNYIGFGEMAVIVLGRLFSGAHWLTDILGGVLLSAALIYLFAGVIDLLPKRR